MLTKPKQGTEKFMIKKLICVSLVLLILASCLVGCSKPPEYALIEQRFIELVERSYGINRVLFGAGLPTYERVYERGPSSYDVYNGEYYYYEIDDPEHGHILAYRTIALKKGEDGKLITAFDYLLRSESKIDGKSAVYEDTANGYYYYDIDYTEPLYDFYYSATDPENYDYVSADSEYHSIEQIKAEAEQVYSRDYLNASVYETLFTGASASEKTEMLRARYIEYTNPDEGDTVSSLMQSNTYSALVSETRIFDFSTARIVKPSSKKLVNIEVETYLESKPDQRQTVRVTMVLQDGQWYLDSGTY